MGLFSWLFGSKTEDRDRRRDDAARKISPAMPMAGAGAELAGQDRDSETERALKRATGEDRSSK
jgi:hypothetical protein